VIETDAGQMPKRLTPVAKQQSILIQIKFSTDGRYALFVFDNGQVTIIDLQEDALESIIQTQNLEIVDVNYHADRKTLLVASFRGTVTAWNSETFQKVATLQLKDARVEYLSSQIAEQGFDLVFGTWDTGLIIKRNVLRESN
jgi:WD40 repeat protein